MADPLLSLQQVSKSFGGVEALVDVSLELEPGEILGLVGENGAGKSTLIKLVSGVDRSDRGVIRWRGRPVRFASPRDAVESGIATIHQELEYCGHLSVAENMLLGERWPRSWLGGVSWRRMRAEARRRLADCGFEIPVEQRFAGLTAAERQEVAIAGALARRSSLLILDEPTASLSGAEVDRLLEHLARLRVRGVSILYVSHRLDEILKLTDRVAVLRDGHLVRTTPTASLGVDELIHDMVGRTVDQVYPATRTAGPGEELLGLEAIARDGLFENVSLSLRAGEIVGLAGPVGSGRSELARAVFGLYPLDRGRMRLAGRPWTPRSPWESIEAGLVYLPEERKRQGLVLEHSLADSLSIGIRDLVSRRGLVDRRAERSWIERLIAEYDIRSTSPTQAVGTLSGGNQQKLLLGRWLAREPRVLILDEPTRGVDVGAKVEIHGLVDRLAAGGCGVLWISSDLPEVVGMSDRVLVMSHGEIVAELEGSDQTESNILRSAADVTARSAGGSEDR